MNDLIQLKNMIKETKNIVFFSGAGISTLSGIKDFRGKKGLNKKTYKYPLEYMLSINCFLKHPEDFFEFYKSKMNCLRAKPNIIHNYLKELEDTGKLKCIITQNIDQLHQKAGNTNVIELHGNVYQNYCSKCYNKFPARYIFNSKGIPKCECGGIIRPNIVLYGEPLSDCYLKAIEEISNCDMLIVAGSSLVVEPASSLIDMYHGKLLVILNDTPTPYDYKANLVINDNLKNIFEYLANENL